MAVSPRQSFAPTTLTVRVHVAPDADNRALEIVADSGDYYRSSRLPLEGNDTPQTIRVELSSVPRGDYEIRGTLFDNTGRATARVRQQASVLASTNGH
jgi:hypothetical protein